MWNQTLIETLLISLDEVGITACAAGGSVYTPISSSFHPQDVDIYLPKTYYDSFITWSSDQDFLASDNTSSGVDYPDWAFKVLNYTVNDTKVQFIFVDKSQDNFTRRVIEEFDFGIVQIGFNIVDGYTQTEARIRDVTDRTITLMNVNRKQDLINIGTRYSKILNRFDNSTVDWFALSTPFEFKVDRDCVLNIYE